MSSTILVVIVLVVMWLVVLVPMFVRRHESDEALIAARSSLRMRVLTRRVAPARTRAAATRPHSHNFPEPDEAAVPPAVRPSAFSHDRARRRMLRRRRRTLLLLVLLVAASWYGASHVTASLWIVQVFATVAVVGYLGWLRQQVRRERARRTRRAALSARTPPPFPAPLGHTRAERPAPARRQPGRQPDGTPILERAATSRMTAGTWEPVPVPVPTYVTKPAAHRLDPVVTLDDDDPAFADIDPVVEPLERRRAANG